MAVSVSWFGQVSKTKFGINPMVNYRKIAAKTPQSVLSTKHSCGSENSGVQN